jgi:membrane protein YqaA with SNARE-associated domain
MEQIKFLIDLFLHLDEYLARIILDYGTWTYGILFFVIFMETGFVVTPFLPGDSLLFAAGTFAALGSLNVWFLAGLLFVAAVAGDAVNYTIGHYLGERAYRIKWIKRNTSIKRMPSSRNTEARRSSWRVSSRSSAPLPHSWRGSAGCPTDISPPTTSWAGPSG